MSYKKKKKKKSFYNKSWIVLQCCNFKSLFWLEQERARKYTRIVSEDCVFRCLFCTAKCLLSTTKHRNKAKFFFYRESRKAQSIWKYAFQMWLLQQPFHALWLLEKLAFGRWRFCDCILSAGVDSVCVFLFALWTAACTSFPRDEIYIYLSASRFFCTYIKLFLKQRYFQPNVEKTPKVHCSSDMIFSMIS